MVEPNTTLFPLLGPIGTVVNTIKVIIGGAFGLYLIILYFRIQEYIVVRRLLLKIQRDLHVIADKQGIELEPLHGLPRVIDFIKEKLRSKPEESSPETAAKPKKVKRK